MNRLKISVLLLAMLPAVPAAAQAQIAGQPLQRKVEAFRAELDALISQHQYDRADQVVSQRLAAGDDPAATYFQIGKIYFDHEAWQRSAGFLERSLKFKGMNDEAHQLLGLDWRALHRPDDAEAELLEAAKENPANHVYASFAVHQMRLTGW